jgi:hypothetical protein
VLGALRDRIRRLDRNRHITIEATCEARLAFLLRDYAYLGDDCAVLAQRTERLRSNQSNETMDRWKSFAETRDLPQLFAKLVDQHYDTLYRRSQGQNHVNIGNAPVLETDDLSLAGIDAPAGRALEVLGAEAAQDAYPRRNQPCPRNTNDAYAITLECRGSALTGGHTYSRLRVLWSAPVWPSKGKSPARRRAWPTAPVDAGAGQKTPQAMRAPPPPSAAGWSE